MAIGNCKSAEDVEGNWVIGSDSVVSVKGRMFNKPVDRDDAAEHLRFFSGKDMRLTSAVALARKGELDWSRGPTRLKVRPLSDAFVADYLDAQWPEVGYTVGVFRLEGAACSCSTASRQYLRSWECRCFLS